MPLQGSEPSGDLPVRHGPKREGRFEEVLETVLDSEQLAQHHQEDAPRAKKREREQTHANLPWNGALPLHPTNLGLSRSEPGTDPALVTETAGSPAPAAMALETALEVLGEEATMVLEAEFVPLDMESALEGEGPEGALPSEKLLTPDPSVDTTHPYTGQRSADAAQDGKHVNAAELPESVRHTMAQVRSGGQPQEAPAVPNLEHPAETAPAGHTEPVAAKGLGSSGQDMPAANEAGSARKEANYAPTVPQPVPEGQTMAEHQAAEWEVDPELGVGGRATTAQRPGMRPADQGQTHWEVEYSPEPAVGEAGIPVQPEAAVGEPVKSGGEFPHHAEVPAAGFAEEGREVFRRAAEAQPAEEQVAEQVHSEPAAEQGPARAEVPGENDSAVKWPDPVQHRVPTGESIEPAGYGKAAKQEGTAPTQSLGMDPVVPEKSGIRPEPLLVGRDTATEDSQAAQDEESSEAKDTVPTTHPSEAKEVHKTEAKPQRHAEQKPKTAARQAEAIGQAQEPPLTLEHSPETVETPVPQRQVLDLRQPEHAFAKLVRTMESLVTEERTEVRIELKPEHLGEMRIKLSMERGIMVAEFLVQDRRVQELISAQLPQLYAALQEQGTVMGDVSINVGLGQDKQAQQEQPHARTVGRGGQGKTDTREVKTAARYTSRSVWYQVDVRV